MGYYRSFHSHNEAKKLTACVLKPSAHEWKIMSRHRDK